MSLPKSVAYNVGKRDPKIPRQIWHKSERRAERFPSGKHERFIDLQGNVVQIVMVPPGVPYTKEQHERKRVELHERKNHDGSTVGFIEHDKCPLRHGTRHLNASLESEFAGMPQELQRPCEDDPRVAVRTAKGVEYLECCPHVKWIMESRIARETERRESRRAQNVNVQDQHLELAKKQAEKMTAVAEKMTSVVEKLTTGRRGNASGGE